MSTWGSRGLRGSQFERLINMSNEKYRELRLGLVQKIPTPITPVEIDDNRHITLAYFEKKSTVDYIGIVQEIPVCFDAKECKTNIFPLSNIHKHQYNFMSEFEEQGGVSFLLIQFTTKNKVAYVPFRALKIFFERGSSGKKSFNIDELEKDYFINIENTCYVLFLDKLQMDIDSR